MVAKSRCRNPFFGASIILRAKGLLVIRRFLAPIPGLMAVVRDDAEVGKLLATTNIS